MGRTRQERGDESEDRKQDEGGLVETKEEMIGGKWGGVVNAELLHQSWDWVSIAERH